MPLEAPISTKWHSRGPIPSRISSRISSRIFAFARLLHRSPRSRRAPVAPPAGRTARARALRAAIAFAVVAGGCFPGLVSALPSAAEEPVVRTALDHMARMQYARAESTVVAGLTPRSPARAFFAGLAAMNRFLDVGDTAALRRAETWWMPLSPRGAPPPAFDGVPPATVSLYRGLAGLQLSYAASMRGHTVRSTALALAARTQLEGAAHAPEAGRPAVLPPEARASLMLFDYYRSRLLEKIPFVGEATFDARAFARAADASPALRDMLLASLFWIHVDHGRFSEAERIAADFLERYPANRLVRDMRAAARFRAGRHAEARAEYEALKAEYAALPRAPTALPLGYYRAVGNLARLHAATGDRPAADSLLAEWRRAEHAGLMPWMPPALRRGLSRL